MSHKVSTTSATFFVGKDGSPVAYRCSLVTDPTVTDGGLFRSNGSNRIKDLGGDPGEWVCFTSDYVMSVAMDDVSGFRLAKGTCSMAKLQGATHTWKTGKTLAEWLASEHPLTENLKGVTLQGIRDAYAALRGEAIDVTVAKPESVAANATVTARHHPTCGCVDCQVAASMMAHILKADAPCACGVCEAVRAGLDQA